MREAIHDLETGEIIERDFTADEIADWEEREAEAVAIRDAAEAKKASIFAALADATGYTPDELREALNA